MTPIQPHPISEIHYYRMKNNVVQGHRDHAYTRSVQDKICEDSLLCYWVHSLLLLKITTDIYDNTPILQVFVYLNSRIFIKLIGNLLLYISFSKFCFQLYFQVSMFFCLKYSNYQIIREHQINIMIKSLKDLQKLEIFLISWYS